jgi:hypothetical protein
MERTLKLFTDPSEQRKLHERDGNEGASTIAVRFQQATGIVPWRGNKINGAEENLFKTFDHQKSSSFHEAFGLALTGPFSFFAFLPSTQI